MIACDLGSNTIRFVEIDCKTKKRVKEFEKIVKTAEDLNKTGEISQKALKRVLDAIAEAKNIFDFSKGIEAVTTEALRRAKNQKEILDEIFKKTGIRFRVISGKEEAFFTNYAVKDLVDTKSYTLIDIGGGSTEITLVSDEIFSNSFSLGIVTLTEEFGLDGLEEGLELKLKEIKEYFKDKKLPELCVATAGTPTTIAAFLKGMDYDSYNYEKVNKTVLKVSDILQAKEKLIKMPFEERKRWVGVGREDLILSGIEIFLGLLKIFNFKECLVVDDGLREGVAKAKCDKKI